jgi:hypothetical protein
MTGYGGEQMGSPEKKDKPSTTLPGTVEKIIKPIDPHAALQRSPLKELRTSIGRSVSKIL